MPPRTAGVSDWTATQAAIVASLTCPDASQAIGGSPGSRVPAPQVVCSTSVSPPIVISGLRMGPLEKWLVLA